MPMTPFMGVRISWLILARNSLLARLAASAASLAIFSSCSARLRSVTSRNPHTCPSFFPFTVWGSEWRSKTRSILELNHVVGLGFSVGIRSPDLAGECLGVFQLGADEVQQSTVITQL